MLAVYIPTQAIPQVTLAVARPNDGDKIRVFTTAVKEDASAIFSVPTESVRLEPGSPSWANYVKGVIALYPGWYLLLMELCMGG